MYHRGLIEIKLMNYGRGAGKTHTLKNWACAEPHRAVVVPFARRNDYASLGTNVLIYGAAVYPRLRAFDGRLEVAFDDFDLRNVDHTRSLDIILAQHPKTVILATSYETMETEAARLAGEKKIIHGTQFRVNETFVIGAECDEAEPVQKVKAKDLRLGDWIIGKGHITSLEAAGHQPGYLSIEVKEAGNQGWPVFEGAFGHVNGDKLFDIDITKRK